MCLRSCAAPGPALLLRPCHGTKDHFWQVLQLWPGQAPALSLALQQQTPPALQQFFGTTAVKGQTGSSSSPKDGSAISDSAGDAAEQDTLAAAQRASGEHKQHDEVNQANKAAEAHLSSEQSSEQSEPNVEQLQQQLMQRDEMLLEKDSQVHSRRTVGGCEGI